MEIERKFLVKDISNLDLSKYNHKFIVQNYLYVDKFTAIRKRKIVENNINKYMYTIKTSKIGISVNEIEKNISEDEYNNLSLNSDYNTIEKERYIIPFGKYTIELDVFKGVYQGIIFAEIEFSSEDSAYEVKLPSWFGSELSSKITNSQMAIYPINKILNILKNV